MSSFAHRNCTAFYHFSYLQYDLSPSLSQRVFLAFRRPFLLDSLLKCLEKAGDHVVVLQFLAEDEALDRVIVGEEGHEILEEESLAVGQEVLSRVDLTK